MNNCFVHFVQSVCVNSLHNDEQAVYSDVTRPSVRCEFRDHLIHDVTEVLIRAGVDGISDVTGGVKDASPIERKFSVDQSPCGVLTCSMY